MTDYGPATEKKIAEVVEACERYGGRSIIALAGVPGTGKSFIASIAAQRFAGEPLFVREIQFHQSFSYEEFIEGMRIGDEGRADVLPGIFLEWNERAWDDPDRRYVLLVEELTRANISAVLGELMTYLEYRDRPFVTLYGRRPTRVAPNLTVLATFNPVDRSAVELDEALLRRMRVVRFLPSTEQLEEMLQGREIGSKVVDRLKGIFSACEAADPAQYEYLMPFGHGIFADVAKEVPDLNRLWEERIRLFLRRPLVDPHPFSDVIEKHYPWRDPDHAEPEDTDGHDTGS
jgi:5-methylcytosine-specific restriction protein B